MYLPIPPTHPLFQFCCSLSTRMARLFSVFQSLRELSPIFVSVLLRFLVYTQAVHIETNSCSAVASVVMTCCPSALGYFCYVNPKILSITACIYECLLFKECVFFYYKCLYLQKFPVAQVFSLCNFHAVLFKTSTH